MKYVIPAVITLIITVGVVICIRMVLNAGKQKISRSKAKRDQKLIRDGRAQIIISDGSGVTVSPEKKP
jgi:hypothetical protein